MLPDFSDTKIDQEEFRNEIRATYETGEMSNELGTMILKLCKGIIYSSKFIYYCDSWKSEMVGDAIEKCVIVITQKKFNVDSLHNPFSYFYSVIQNTYLNRVGKNYKRNEGIEQYKDLEYTRIMRDFGDMYVKPPEKEINLSDE